MRVPFIGINISLPVLRRRPSVRQQLEGAAQRLQRDEVTRIQTGQKGTEPTEASLRRGKRQAVETQKQWEENRRTAHSRESIW